MLRAVFFDAAGTLFDTREPVGALYASVARRFGVDADDRVVAAAFRRVFSSAPPLAFGLGHSTEDLRRMEREWWRSRVAETFSGLGRFADFDAYFGALFTLFGDPATWRPNPGAHSTLEMLRARGLLLGIVSNFDARLYGILEGLGFAPFFNSITISSEAGYAKPARGIFGAALTKHSLEPGEALHIGDSVPLDVAGAAAARISSILFDPEQNHQLGSLKVKGRVSSLPQLAEIVTRELS